MVTLLWVFRVRRYSGGVRLWLYFCYLDRVLLSRVGRVMGFVAIACRISNGYSICRCIDFSRVWMLEF